MRWFVRDGEGGGGRVSGSSARSDPQMTEGLRRNNNAKAVVTSPVRSNLCTPLIAVSTAVRSSDTKTMSVAQLLRNN